jgi:DNA repair protein RadD
MTIELRNYQQEAIDRVRQQFSKGKKRVCFQLSTGGGKTIIAAFMIQNAIKKGLKVLFLVHLKELIQQTSEKIALLDIQHGVICQGYQPVESNCQLAMVQTFARRLEKNTFKPDLIVVDECHHSVSNTYKNILIAFPDVKVVGLTATPERLDGKGLGEIADVLVEGPKTKWLIENGFLNTYKYYSVDQVDTSKVHTKMGDFDKKELDEEIEKSGIIGEVVHHYNKYLKDGKAIVFCTKVAHSEDVCARFKAAGISAAHLDGRLDKATRQTIISDFRSGKIKVLTNCSLISEGFDVPDCDGVIMLRPTLSLGLFLQMVGRGLRPSENPTIILDHVGNYQRHYMPDTERVWSLEGRVKKKKKVGEINVTVCDVCFAVYTTDKTKCPLCNAARTKIQRSDIEEHDGELKEINGIEIERNETGSIKRTSLNQLTRQCKSLEDLKSLAKKLGYKDGWATYLWGIRTNKKRRVMR